MAILDAKHLSVQEAKDVTTPCGPAETEIRRLLRDKHQSALQKYRRLNVGRPGLWPLLRYELLTAGLGNMPGALGLFLRQKLYRRLWKHCGRGVVIGRNVTIRHPHRIVLGNRVVIDDYCVLDGKGNADTTIVIGDDAIIGRNTVLSCKGGTIRLGDRTNISVNCTLISETTLDIGPHVLIAGHCYLIAGGNHGLDRTDVPMIDQPSVQRGGVHIAENCWLGAQVTILDGTTIGRDAVIAAGAVVNRSVGEFAIAAGVPAKTVRDRRQQR